MDAVILAAGRGTRMQPLTDATPKPLLPVAGKPIIDHAIDALPDNADVTVVAGYKKDLFIDHFQDEAVRIIEQEEPLGTGHAALQAREYVEGKTMILMGDDLYGAALSQVTEYDRAVLAAQVDNPSVFGVFTTDNGNATGIVEKPETPPSSLANTGCYVVQEDFFPLLDDLEESPRGEYEITDAVHQYLQRYDVELVETGDWYPCSYPWQLLTANAALLSDLPRNIRGDVADTAVIKGNVVVADGAVIHDHVVVEGPALIKTGAEIKPHSHVRPGTVIHENATVKHSEVKNSVVGPGSNVPHFNYVGDSYIGRDVNFGAGTITANTRNDGEPVRMEVKGELLETGREKLGAVIGAEAKTGINCSIQPGRKIGCRTIIDSHEKIVSNIPSDVIWKNGDVYADRR